MVIGKLLGGIGNLLAAPFRFLGRVFGRIGAAGRGLGDFFNAEVEDEPLGDTIEKVVADPWGVLPHLAALRGHLLRAVLFLALATSLSFSLANPILEFLARPLPNGLDSIQAIDITEPISVLMRIALLSGFAIALPYIAFELVLFIAPGLKPRARRFLIFIAIPISTLLFLGGMAFAYYGMLPAAVPFLLGILDFQTNIRASSYVRFVTGVMFWLGVVFQMPLVIYVIARLGFIKARVLADQWRLAIILIAILAAAITPTIDPVNMALVMGPLILLYFVSVGLAFFAQRGRPA
jgi:sec-independent protein translocase protein TatC